MLNCLLFLKKRKIFNYIFAALILSLCLMSTGVNFAQTQEEIEKMKSIQIINPHPPFSLRLWLDKGRGEVYAPGERIRIFFQVSRDSYVKIYNYDTRGRVKIIFPNRYTPNNFVRAGETRTIEGVIDPHTQPGVEYVQGFATTRPMFLDNREKELISKEVMPEISKDFKNFTVTLKGIIVSMPPTAWTSSNLLRYTVRPVTPPPTYYGRIIVTSQPQRAKVYLDNVYKGLTPLKLDRVTAGQHHIKLERAGYQDWSDYVSVSPSRTTTISANLVPLPAYGSISVYCNQGNAKIYLNGNYQRRTYANQSVEIKNIKPGYHELVITKDGYQDWVSTILVVANQTRTVSDYLVPEIKYGSLAIYCNVSGAKIFANGTYKAVSSSSQPKILEEIKEGEYEITLVKDGYRTWVEDIWVYAGETTSIYVEMIEIE
ncbi:MAG TPA: PEGA domain-containing protein [Candidatus Atribacteria bacterium]|nr:PEGA domain-containing protein [Candidatus Atribacteria bacterium]